MKLFLVVTVDRHCDNDYLLYRTKDEAVAAAKKIVERCLFGNREAVEHTYPGLVFGRYYCASEGDGVLVHEVEVL